MDFHAMITQYGAVGVFIAMFLESSIIPIPSEAVLLTAGYLGIPFRSILWCGALGSTLGACVGYGLGCSAFRWIVERHGRWIGLTSHRLQRFDESARRYGKWWVLIGRILPIIPFKVFSIAAGMGRISFVLFIAMTFLGVIPRIILLTFLGQWIKRATIPALVLFVLGTGLFFFIRRRKMKRPCST